MRLSDIVAAAVADQQTPAAALALIYAERIDQANHVTTTLADALDKLHIAAQLADESAADDTHTRAYRKVADALAAVTVASDLGPKLLAALDALLATPKAQATVKRAIADTTASPLDRLRDRHASRRLRAVG